jgi:predicted N-acetyltransferase YhbS
MRDMLVRLHRVASPDAALQRAANAGVTLRRAESSDEPFYEQLVEREFAASWRGGLAAALSRAGPSAFVAIARNQLIGFALWNIAYCGYFGPTGVAESWRGKGIGAALLLATLDTMRGEGHAYVVIGKVGPAEFYEHVCGAELIDGEPAP